MAIADYLKAYKMGEREYRARVSRGEYPYLPVLDEIVSHVDIEAQVSLGLVEVPLKSVVGTYSAGRTTAFARNFMPILAQDSEFASKWGQLYDELEEEGLRDPIKAYEFNNKFYVMEGNKRVSVSKYMDAVSIEANVTRMVPRRSDDPENRIYYEFMDFYEATGINYLYMSREGNFQKLLYLTYGAPKGEGWHWTKEQEQDFRAFYVTFEKAYLERGSSRGTAALTITPGDAVCIYLEIYGYDAARDKAPAQIKQDVSRMWNEFVIYSSGEAQTLVLGPTAESQRTSLIKLFPVGAQVTKVAFIHDRSAQESAWTYGHELGRKYVQEVFGDKIATSSVERVQGEEADDVFEAAIEAGNKVIFATSPKLMNAALKCSLAHPEVILLNCSMNLTHKTLRSYYLRMYEAKFISGAIAGAMRVSQGGRIGYLSDYPIHGTTAEINAFALGVQMTAPSTRVLLDWSMLRDHDALAHFQEEGVAIVSGRDLNARSSSGRVFGLYTVDYATKEYTNLAMPVRNWGKLYEEIIRSILRGGYKNDEDVFNEQALNYFWGMSSGAIDVIYSRNLPPGQVRLLRGMRNAIRNMDFNPFTGPIYSQDGTLRCEDGQELRAREAVNIDWLCENIDGYLPDISELRDEAVDLVKLQGVKG